MKYAIVNIERRRINRVTDETPQFVGEQMEVVEITDEQAAAIAASDTPSFLIDGELKSMPEVMAIRRAEREAARLTELYAADPEAAKAAKINQLRAARDAVEFGGITFNGLPVQTNMVTQARLTSALSLVALNPATVIKWEFPDGSIVDLDKATVEALAAAVFGHVQQTRTDFAAAKALVDAAATAEGLHAI
jgi:hypothetical protein